MPPVGPNATRLVGRPLRSACLALFRRYGQLRLDQLHTLIHLHGYLIASDHPVKALADAMAYELRKGRLRRPARGVYELVPGIRFRAGRHGTGPRGGLGAPTAIPFESADLPVDPVIVDDPASWYPEQERGAPSLTTCRTSRAAPSSKPSPSISSGRRSIPFLFCVHHLDKYPDANEFMGPNASLEARDIGMDFEGADGWRMYHGSTVPGFPQHPHRGFETVTFVRQGYVDHSDSLGATARFGRGDVQWLTAGAGIVHCEMFPLLDRNGPNPCELFQIWMNLPADDKMVDPYFTMLWDHEIPRHNAKDGEGRATEVTVIAGALEGLQPPAGPPNSWASRPKPTSPSGTSSPNPARSGPCRRPRAPTPSARCTSSRARSTSATTTSKQRPARSCAPTSPSPSPAASTAPRPSSCKVARSASPSPSTARSS